MKKLLFLFTLVLLTSCNVNTFHTDPSVKESERIAVLEKAKTDTLTTVVQMDDYVYHVKDGKIVQRAETKTDAFLVVFLIGILIGVVSMGIIMS